MARFEEETQVKIKPKFLNFSIFPWQIDYQYFCAFGRFLIGFWQVQLKWSGMESDDVIWIHNPD